MRALRGEERDRLVVQTPDERAVRLAADEFGHLREHNPSVSVDLLVVDGHGCLRRDSRQHETDALSADMVRSEAPIRRGEVILVELRTLAAERNRADPCFLPQLPKGALHERL